MWIDCDSCLSVRLRYYILTRLTFAYGAYFLRPKPEQAQPIPTSQPRIRKNRKELGRKKQDWFPRVLKIYLPVFQETYTTYINHRCDYPATYCSTRHRSSKEKKDSSNLRQYPLSTCIHQSTFSQSQKIRKREGEVTLPEKSPTFPAPSRFMQHTVLFWNKVLTLQTACCVSKVDLEGHPNPKQFFLILSPPTTFHTQRHTSIFLEEH